MNVGSGYFLSKQDPLYWKKLLQMKSDDAEAMYHVGLDMEHDANKHLVLYKKNNLEASFNMYKSKIKESHRLLNKSLNKGYILARQDVNRIQKEINCLNIPGINMASTQKKVKSYKTILVLVLCVLFLLIGVIMTLIFGDNFIAKHSLEQITNNFTLMIPYKVLDETPQSIPDLNYTEIKIEVPSGISKQDLVNSIVGSLKDAYARESAKPIKIMTHIKENGIVRDVGLALWGGGDHEMQIYVFPSFNGSLIEYYLWETTTVLRSALYQFTKKNGSMPSDLRVLASSYPNNYLSDIPKEPYTLSNKVSSVLDGSGGWVYRPNLSSFEGIGDNNLQLAIKESVTPNLKDKDISFSPITLEVSKTEHILTVISGENLIKKYFVALGKNGSTPQGCFYIDEKIMNPNKWIPIKDNVFGTRGMELSDKVDAIHGTNEPTSIGTDASLGCIRLLNTDVEELYSYVPLYTQVNISNNLSNTNPDSINLSNLDSRIAETPFNQNDPFFYSKEINPQEENATTYHWNN